jgi:hypothetical protein
LAILMSAALMALIAVALLKLPPAIGEIRAKNRERQIIKLIARSHVIGGSKMDLQLFLQREGFRFGSVGAEAVADPESRISSNHPEFRERLDGYVILVGRTGRDCIIAHADPVECPHLGWDGGLRWIPAKYVFFLLFGIDKHDKVVVYKIRKWLTPPGPPE